MSFRPAVHTNRHRETAIAYRVERGTVYFVTMRAGTIDVEHLSVQRFVDEFSLVLPYPVRRAAKRYLNSVLAKTDRARKALRSVANS